MGISLDTVKSAFTFAIEQCSQQLEALEKVISQKIAIRDCMLKAIGQDESSGSVKKCHDLKFNQDSLKIPSVDRWKFFDECPQMLPPQKQISDITNFINGHIKENVGDDQPFSCRSIKASKSTADSVSCISEDKTFSFSMYPSQNSQANYNGMLLQSSRQLTDDTIFNRETLFDAETLETSFGAEYYVKDGMLSSEDPNTLSYKVSNFISENSDTFLEVSLIGALAGTMVSLIKLKSLFKEFKYKGINPQNLPPEERKRVLKTQVQLYVASAIAVLSGVLLLERS